MSWAQKVADVRARRDGNGAGTRWVEHTHARPDMGSGYIFVTPGFKDKPECKNTCAPGSSYTHVSTQ
jgi:hypothetical protein